jgi:hypothetical protein
MFIPDPDVYPSRISDPKTAIKERSEKKLVFIPFFVAINFTKLKIVLFLECRRKKLGKFSKNNRTFYPKNSGDSGVKKAPDPESGSSTLLKRRL